MKAVYGLMVAYRDYKCAVCDEPASISTSHTGGCMDYCKGCSWRSDWEEGRAHNFIAGSFRPMEYAGKLPTEDMHNPNSGVEWVDPTLITKADLDELRINDRPMRIERTFYAGDK